MPKCTTAHSTYLRGATRARTSPCLTPTTLLRRAGPKVDRSPKAISTRATKPHHHQAIKIPPSSHHSLITDRIRHTDNLGIRSIKLDALHTLRSDENVLFALGRLGAFNLLLVSELDESLDTATYQNLGGQTSINTVEEDIPLVQTSHRPTGTFPQRK